ncbi:hypothetical protein DFH06DRAFT_1291623 [Mycena polygramma]|nr:hypothetical protein DFH06DRAFT_1291623 [Mycena polygramma]
MSSSEQHLVNDMIAVTLGVSIPGIVLSVFLLATIAGLQLHPVSRPQLDRVSFRLLTYALVANVVFGVVTLPVMKETSPGCSLVAFLVLVSPLFCTCMFCSMALNLQLVLVYGVNGNRMEKLYVVGAILLCGACTIPAWASGALGWQTTNDTCWIRNTTPTDQLHWLLATQSVPMLLMSTLELFSFLRIIIFMIVHQIRIRRLRMSPSIETSMITNFESSLPKHPVVRFRWMIVRIALYPLLSCFLSVTACVLDVYGVQHSTDFTDFTITLDTTNLFVYCLRPLLYTLLAATDSSFLRAVRSLQWTPLSRWRKQTEKNSSKMVGQSSWGTGASQEMCLPNQLLMAEAEELTEEELRSESIGQQL